MEPRAIPTTFTRNEELEEKLSRSIDLPLAALRASLESLNESLPGTDPLGGIIQEVLRIGANVRELVEFTCPPCPRPVTCSALEVTFNALRGLSSEHRERVILARVEATGNMHTDPTLLASGLRRVIENALEATADQILLTVRQRAGETVFSVIDRSSEPFDAGLATTPFLSTKKNHLGLGLALTQRDLGLVGGSLRLDRTNLGDTCVVVTVPDEHSAQAAA
jgi:signal transduction histidine kinase